MYKIGKTIKIGNTTSTEVVYSYSMSRSRNGENKMRVNYDHKPNETDQEWHLRIQKEEQESWGLNKDAFDGMCDACNRNLRVRKLPDPYLMEIDNVIEEMNWCAHCYDKCADEI